MKILYLVNIKIIDIYFNKNLTLNKNYYFLILIYA